MGIKDYLKFMTPDGLLNEFKLVWHLRESFPLHYIVFKQTACHRSHEANVEQIFSRAGLLTDPNLDPASKPGEWRRWSRWASTRRQHA